MILLMLNPGLRLEERDIADVEPRTKIESKTWAIRMFSLK